MSHFDALSDWLLPEEDGLMVGRVCPESLARLGGALVRAGTRVLVGYAPESGYTKATACSLCGAIAAAGGHAVLVPDCVPIELGSASTASDCDLLLHIDDTQMRAFARGLLPLTANQTDALSERAAGAWLQRADYGSIVDGEGLRLLYPAGILRRLPDALTMLPEICTASERLQKLFARLFRGGRGTLLTVQMASDGRRVSLYTEEQGWVFYERLLLLVCLQYFVEGRDVALPYWMPRAAEQLAGNYHRRVLRYASASDGTDAEGRALALRQGFTLDAAVLCAEFLRILAERNGDLAGWLAELPPCYTVRRILQSAADSHAVPAGLSAFHPRQTAEGWVAQDARGQALLRPSRSGRSLTLFTEANSMEAATELAGDLAACLERAAHSD